MKPGEIIYCDTSHGKIYGIHAVKFSIRGYVGEITFRADCSQCYEITKDLDKGHILISREEYMVHRILQG
jgi:hypothetical protein